MERKTMRKIIALIVGLFVVFNLQAQETKTQLQTRFDVIRNELVAGANTKTRVANAYQELSDGSLGVYPVVTTGTDTYAGTLLGLDAYSGRIVFATFPNNNTGASTININTIGAANIQKYDAGWTALEADDIVANKLYRLYHDGTRFQIDLGGAGGSVVWGDITGTLSDQTDLQTALDTKAVTTRLINTTSPITGGGDLSADRTIAINNAAADGSTKGAASFTATDFDATSGNVAIDYTNGQSASTSLKGFLTNTDWNTFNNKQATGLSWLLTGTSTLTGSSTIASNARNQFNFGGTWTSTVTGDYHVNWGGSITALSGGANTLNYMTMTPTITANNNSQVLNGLVIDPTYSVGAFTGTTRSHLQLGNSTVGTIFEQSPDNASRGLKISSKNTWASYAFQFSTGSQNTTSGTLNGMLINGTFNPASGTGSYAQLNLGYTLNQSGGTGIIRGIYYNPAITAVINHTALQTTSGRLAFNMTGNPTSQVQFRAAGTSTSSHILVEDASQNQMLNILDNGDIRIGGATDYTRIRQPLGGNTKGLEFESQPGHLTYAFRFNIAGQSGSNANGNTDGVRTGSTINANGATTGIYNELLITSDLDVTHASAIQTLRHIKVDSNINATAGTTTVRGFDYDPTVASATGLTHYGVTVRPAATLNGFGTGTPTSTLVTAGSFATGYVAKTGTYSATVNDYTIDCTSGTFTVTLPTAVGITGRIYTIVNSGAGTITVGTTSSQTFANVTATPTTLTMATLGARVVQSNGANWILISSL